MSNLKDRIAAFENRNNTGSGGASTTNNAPTSSKPTRINGSELTSTSGGGSGSGNGHPSGRPLPPTKTTSSNPVSTTTTTNNGNNTTTPRTLPPTPTDRTSLNVGLNRTNTTTNNNNTTPPTVSPRIITTTPTNTTNTTQVAAGNSQNHQHHHPTTSQHQPSPTINTTPTTQQENSATLTPVSPSSSPTQTLTRVNSAGQQDNLYDMTNNEDGNMEDDPRRPNDVNAIHQLPKNKPAVPKKFRNTPGTTTTNSTLGRPTPKVPPSIPQARRAVTSSVTQVDLPTSENGSEPNTTTTNVDPGSTITYSDSFNSSRISIRPSANGMPYASGIVGLGDKLPQGKFIPYVPPEVEDTVVSSSLTKQVKLSITSESDAETLEFQEIYKHPTKKQQDAAVILQKYIRRWDAKKAYKKMQKARLNRENCAKEILSTEKYYVESLNILQEVYLKPFKAMAAKDKPLITKEEVSAIFSDIDVILNFNNTFLKDLEERLQNYVYTVTISDIFLQIAPFFKTYSRYCNNFDKANEVLRECKKREEFKEQVSKMDKDSRTSKLGLQSYLILPIQRIPRYRLLLQDLIKHSGPSHPDYKGLKLALEKICEVADHLNNTMKSIEATNEIIKIQSQFYGELNLVEPHRKFLKDGALQEIVSADFTKTRDIYVHLFNDIILLSQKSGKTFTLKLQLPLNDLIIFSYLNQEDQIDDTIFKLQSPSKAIIIKTATPAEKNSWTITLHNLINESKISKKNKTLNVDVHTIADDSSTTFALAMSDNDGIVIPPEECIRRMKAGSTMLKYCRTGKPHFRRFVLSSDETELMWGSPNKQSNESIVSLTDVKKICYGQNTAIFQKYKNPDLEGLSFSLLYRDRTLDIVCKDKQEYHTWVQGITYLLSHLDSILKKKTVVPVVGNEPKFAPITIVHDMENEKQKFKEQFERIGDAYTWGQGASGSLGHGNQEDKKEPLVMKDFLYLDVSMVACENSAGAAVMFTGELFTWGKGEKGRLGHETFRNMPVKQIAAGSAHSGCITEGDGAVYMWGSGIYGQIGNNTNTHALTPMRVKFGKLKAKQLVCGVNHVLVLMEDGSVYGWGAGTYGRLGNGNESDQRVPVRINFFDDKNVRGLGAGGSSSAAVCAHQWVPDKDADDCMSCKSKFTFLRRRHHCRYCGGIFCGSCTGKRITLLRFGFDEPVRVCDNCYQILTNAAQTYKR
ncbi:RhoGEF domain-containing protein [Naegleria gruberi]|uniref:RhoGEF domain-containing protein n=1 Tax=Naegleria gruberi TaxID=5762 RepID=D2VHP8_NAEGR|nr:RhoGEF domain-containing protein [Naegleria gruberi]EFC43629.1 RhoGEF domain-containing protein [Naegleria gruberi]|eukprot:XP_002676373.1 RhoGEF domain-containing protein [Naegleria gruberi strain NEG-M]